MSGPAAGAPPGGPSVPPGILRILQASHRSLQEAPRAMRDAQEEGPPPVVADDRRISEVTAEELEGTPWLPPLFFHHPEDQPFPGEYAVLAQPFLAPGSETGYRNAEGVSLSYLVVFVTGAVAVGADLRPESVTHAFHETLRRATQLAKELSQEMGNAPVRLMIARMPEWMARKLHPPFRSVRAI